MPLLLRATRYVFNNQVIEPGSITMIIVSLYIPEVLRKSFVGTGVWLDEAILDRMKVTFEEDGRRIPRPHSMLILMSEEIASERRVLQHWNLKEILFSSYIDSGSSNEVAVFLVPKDKIVYWH